MLKMNILLLMACLSFCLWPHMSAALQIGDAQYAGSYNGKSMSAAQAKINGIRSRDVAVPVGTVAMYPFGQEPPDPENWIECDGREIDADKYPELYRLAGANVPDYRGVFLRGHGGNSAGLGELQDSSTYMPNTITSNSLYRTYQGPRSWPRVETYTVQVCN